MLGAKYECIDSCSTASLELSGENSSEKTDMLEFSLNSHEVFYTKRQDTGAFEFPIDDSTLPEKMHFVQKDIASYAGKETDLSFPMERLLSLTGGKSGQCAGKKLLLDFLSRKLSETDYAVAESLLSDCGGCGCSAETDADTDTYTDMEDKA